MTALVLIGPPGAGKSTLGAGLAAQLQLEFVDADAVAAPLYAEVGWSVDRFRDLIVRQGYERAHREWEEALAHAVERLVATCPGTVIALGAGHTHLTRPGLAARVRVALAGVDRVLLVRPAPDLAASLAILRRRCEESKGHGWLRDGVDWLHRWSTDGCDELLATETVHTGGESPEQTLSRLVAGA